MKMASPFGGNKSPSPDMRPKSTPRLGASTSSVQFKDRIASYFRAHHYEMLSSIKRVMASPFSTLVTSLVIAIAVFLPAALVIALGNLQQLSGNWDGTPKISVYMQKNFQESQIGIVKNAILRLKGVKSLDYISPAQALDEFKTGSGFADILYDLEENPLPAVFSVTPNEQGTTNAGAEELLVGLEAIETVEQAHYDLEWVKRLNSFMLLANRIVLGLTVLFSLGAILVVGNTIRLAIENRRQEIVVVKLVGATHAFVRRPFLYLGSWYGLLGGTLAWLMTQVGLLSLAVPVAALAEVYHSNFGLVGFGLSDSLLMIVCTGTLGWLGAWLAVAHHLDEIEPR